MAGRVYRSDVKKGMWELDYKLKNPMRPGGAKVTLVPSRFFGTKVMPFNTFGVTAEINVNGQRYVGTGIAPMATSSGVREPQAVGDLKLARFGISI